MFKGFLASLGVGAAKIDLVLDQHAVHMGENITGKIILKGGGVEQTIEGLSVEFRLASSYKKGDVYLSVNEKVATIPISNENFTVQENQLREFPFAFTCPKYLPVSSVCTRYYFQTNLDIRSGLDSRDRDFVDVYPVGLQKDFLDGFQALGFVHHSEGYSGSRNGYQVIQFRPTTWLKGQYDEIVFAYCPSQTQQSVSGYYELDKKTTGLLGMLADELDLDEKKGRFHFDAHELATVDQAATTLRQFIMKNSASLIG